jgi:hypothetical protein
VPRRGRTLGRNSRAPPGNLPGDRNAGGAGSAFERRPARSVVICGQRESSCVRRPRGSRALPLRGLRGRGLEPPSRHRFAAFVPAMAANRCCQRLFGEGASRRGRPEIAITWHHAPALRTSLPTPHRSASARPKSGSTLLRPPKLARATARARYRSERLQNAAAGAERLLCSQS